MEYNHDEFVYELEKKGRVVELAPDVVVAFKYEPDECVDTDYLGGFKRNIQEYCIDRKEGVVYGKYVHKTYELSDGTGVAGEADADNLWVTRDGEQLLTELALRDFTQNQIKHSNFFVHTERKIAMLEVSDYVVLERDLSFDYDYGDVRYFANDNYTPYDHPDVAKWLIHDLERLDSLGNTWWYEYLVATLYVAGQKVASDSLGAIESDGDNTDAENDLLEELKDYRKHLKTHIDSLFAQYVEESKLFTKYLSDEHTLTEVK